MKRIDRFLFDGKQQVNEDNFVLNVPTNINKRESSYLMCMKEACNFLILVGIGMRYGGLCQ